ncbi:MAG: hypothetical protein CL816_01970 [Coxiellaceae bacterium]|nr:hypothetical protein [Coxiellaceae bacterium]
MSRFFLLSSLALLFANRTHAELLRGIAPDQDQCPQTGNDDDNAVWAKWHQRHLTIIGLLRDHNGKVSEYSQLSESSCLPALDNTRPSVHKEDGTYFPLKEFNFISYDAKTNACIFNGRCFNGREHLFTLTPTKNQDLSQNDSNNHPIVTA